MVLLPDADRDGFQEALDMKIQFRFVKSDTRYTQCAIVMNDVECGQVSMKMNEAVQFTKAVQLGCSQTQDEFTWTGDIDLPEDWVLWHKRSGLERRHVKDRRSGAERRVKRGQEES